MRRRVLMTVCALLLMLATAGAAAASALARVPQGFAGVAIDGALWPPQPGVNLNHQLDLMVAAGVESIRAQIDWNAVQPYRGWAEVPVGQRARFTNVGGLPLALGQLDVLVGSSADRGLRLLPLVANAPGWDALPRSGTVALQTPRDTAPYARFAGALAHRYGSHGSFWTGRATRLPIRAWELWNEPNLDAYWHHQPDFATSYVRLLKAGHDAVKAADPHAQVVLAGLANASWVDVAQILRVPGASRLFDVAALHPYTRKPSGVLTIATLFRAALDHGGARHRPILIDEFGWNSSLGRSPNAFGIETTEAGQATKVDQAIRLLVAARGRLNLVGLDYYNWAGHEFPGAYEFDFAGLFRIVGNRFVSKPVFRAFRRDVLGLEGCARKSTDARRCAQRARTSRS